MQPATLIWFTVKMSSSSITSDPYAFKKQKLLCVILVQSKDSMEYPGPTLWDLIILVHVTIDS